MRSAVRVWRVEVDGHVELVRAGWLPDGRIGFRAPSSGRLVRLVSTGSAVRLEQGFRTVSGPATVLRPRARAEVVVVVDPRQVNRA